MSERTRTIGPLQREIVGIEEMITRIESSWMRTRKSSGGIGKRRRRYDQEALQSNA